MKSRLVGKWNNLKHKQLYLMLLVPLIYLVLFCYAPMYGVVIAFQNYNSFDGFFGSEWVGLYNFERFISQPDFWVLIKNTLIISLYSLVVYTVVPIAFALLLYEVQNKYVRRFVQTVTYAPYFISGVIIATMCYTFLDIDTGIITKVLALFGVKPKQYMYLPSAYYSIYVLSGLWQGLGWWTIIYMGTLSTVDPCLHDAATIDGASRLRRIWHINIPAILPVAVVMFIMAVGNIMSVGFEKSWLLMNTQNKPAAKTIATYVYEVSLVAQVRQFSLGAAVGLFNSVINIILLIRANFISKRITKTSLW